MGYRRYAFAIALAMIAFTLPVGGTDVGPMADTDGPLFIADDTPSSAFVGDPIEFNTTITDETGVQNASVEYWIGSTAHISLALTLTSGNTTNGTWATTIVAPGTLQHISYLFYAFDTLANSRSSGPQDINLVDNMGPKVEDFTAAQSGKATTGDDYSFFANVSDNVAVNLVKVHYEVGSPTWLDKNVTMEPMSVDGKGNGLWVFNLTVFTNSTESFRYTLWARDTSNNVRVTRGQVDTIDNDRPWIEDDRSDAEGFTGDELHFEIEVTDNVEIDKVKVFWAYGTTAPRNQTMTALQTGPTGDGKYQRNVTLPTDFVGNLWYQFLVADSSNRWNFSEVVDISVSDNDGPVLDPDNSHAVGDERFDFEVNVTDNIGVEMVWVLYNFVGEPPVNVTMTPQVVDDGGNGSYGNVGVGIPLDKQVNLRYFLGAIDVNGFATIIEGEYQNVDNIIPTLGENGTIGEPVKGHSIDVWVTATDNFGVADVRIEYWFGTAAVKNDSMEADGGNYSFTIHIPRNPAGDLMYSFHATDIKGNWNHSMVYTVVPYNLAPEVAEVDLWEITEEENEVLDLAPYMSDGNDVVTALEVTTDADGFTVDGLRLMARFDEWMEGFTINCTVTDGEDSTNFTVDITITNVNDLAVFTSEPVKTAEVSVEYVYPVLFTDEDIGQTYTFSFDEAPAGMTVAANGRITWTPTMDQEGNHNVDLALDDGYNVVHQQWTVVVAERPTDDPPAFTNDPPSTHSAGTLYMFDFDAEDPDGDPIVFRLVSGPEGAEIDENTGELTWNVKADKRDTTVTEDFVVRVSDFSHDTDKEFSVAVSYPTNDPPVITGSPPKVTTDRDTSVNLGEYMSDPDDEKVTLEWNASTDAKAFTVHMNGNHLVITIKEGRTGKGTVTLKLEDPWGEFDSTELQVEVQASDDDGGALGDNMLFIAIAVVAVIVVLGLVYILKGGPKDE
ncbi:MAG: hypothetical protein JSW25_08620 [Thermoplasmata archaeon]|nr:MAG: hypothetical protein JSW25_08620 [Thermoplasmata archaeon]